MKKLKKMKFIHTLGLMLENISQMNEAKMHKISNFYTLLKETLEKSIDLLEK